MSSARALRRARRSSELPDHAKDIEGALEAQALDGHVMGYGRLKQECADEVVRDHMYSELRVQ